LPVFWLHQPDWANSKTKDETERATFFEMARAWLRAASVIDDTLPRNRGPRARLCADGTRFGDILRHAGVIAMVDGKKPDEVSSSGQVKGGTGVVA